MPKRDQSQEALHALRMMEQEGPSPERIAQLRKLLNHRSNHVVGRAAKLVASWQVYDAVPDLVEAFGRFMLTPTKSDPSCAAKLPIIEALDALDYGREDVYLAAVRHRQPEPSFGEPIDTAAGLRGAAGNALLHCGYPDAYLEMADLLRDKEPVTRRMAVEALAKSGAYQAELLLRMAVLADDPEIDVMSLALQGLMQLAPQRSLEFVKRYLDCGDPALAEGAALAIGEARIAESLPTLLNAWRTAPRRACLYLLLPVALTREEEAFEFLLDLVRNETDDVAAMALKALSIFEGQPERAAAIAAAKRARQ